MRIALLADIHGNLVGLDACLADLEAQGGADVIVAAGDLCMDGPKPKKVLQRLADVGARCVRGNTDRYLADVSYEPLGVARTRMEWTRRDLGEKWLAWLRDLPASLRFGSVENQLLVVHASPVSDELHMWPDADDAALEASIGREPATVIAFGHLHLPYARLWRGRLLVNAASAGLPKDGDARAGYAILTERSGGWEVKHRRVAFDVKRVATQLADCGIPGAVDLVATLRRHRYKGLKASIP
ncbi:MAG: metallophosphoesterase family protein [Vulcanimicrobiaceae bacterium]